MEWLQFVMRLEELNPERVEAVFLRNGAHSVTLSDAGDRPVLEPAPGETPLWKETRIAGLFGPETDLHAVARELRQSLDVEELPEYHFETLENRVWEREWERDFGPMRFGRRLWVCPGDTTAEDGAVVVRLDPGLAFGTGSHATTAMCLEWLDDAAVAGCSLLDYGCGSGILAIAALQLGCAHAHAMDIDVQAVTATRRNAKHNNVLDRLSITGGPEHIDGAYDIVVANILAGPLCELAGSICKHVRSRGSLVLSGILANQVGDVTDAYAPWIEFDKPETRGQSGQTWTRLSGRKR